MRYELTDSTRRLIHRLDQGVVRQALITGPVGTGKTTFAKYYAQAREAHYLYTLCHPWVTDEDFFHVLDVAAIAVGVQEKSEAWTPGILRLAAEASHHGQVVLCLDEIDKVSQKVEVLLLDFLQNGQVPMPDHRQFQACQANLVVFLTSNGQRRLSDALLRRLYRFEMHFLPPDVEAGILRQATGAPMPLVKKVIQLANLLRSEATASNPSLAEMQLLLECFLCEKVTMDSIEEDGRATLIKSKEDLQVLKKTGNWVAMLYGLIRQELVQKKYLVSV